MCHKTQANQNHSSVILQISHGKKQFIDPIYQPLRSGRIWYKVNF